MVSILSCKQSVLTAAVQPGFRGLCRHPRALQAILSLDALDQCCNAASWSTTYLFVLFLKREQPFYWLLVASCDVLTVANYINALLKFTWSLLLLNALPMSQQKCQSDSLD